MAQVEGSPEQKTRMGTADRVFRAILISLVVGILVVAGVVAFALFFLTRNSIVVVNESGQPLHNVTVDYEIYGQPEQFRVLEQKLLQPGEEMAHSHRYNDLTVTLSFTLKGKEMHHTQFVDLWTGETYVFRVQPDGTVTSKHERD
jgi:hypothetical protein